MRHFRFSITGLMGLVLVAAVGLAALRNASETRSGGMLLLTCGILALAVVGALYRDGAQRAWWLSGLSPVIARLYFLTVPSLILFRQRPPPMTRTGRSTAVPIRRRPW
jgi:hypothetical protein